VILRALSTRSSGAAMLATASGWISVGEELRRQRIVDQRREDRRPTVWHNAVLVEVITRVADTALSTAAHRPSGAARARGAAQV
jgi:hypothetical protein